MFKVEASIIARRVPPLEKHTPIMPDAISTELMTGSFPTLEALEAGKKLDLLRRDARERDCPFINSVNPTYPGSNTI